MKTNTMDIWYKIVYQPYIAVCAGESGLLLDDFIVLKNSEIMALMNDDKVNRYIISPHYTGLLQPCDIGINKSLTERLQNLQPIGEEKNF